VPAGSGDIDSHGYDTATNTAGTLTFTAQTEQTEQSRNRGKHFTIHRRCRRRHQFLHNWLNDWPYNAGGRAPKDGGVNGKLRRKEIKQMPETRRVGLVARWLVAGGKGSHRMLHVSYGVGKCCDYWPNEKCRQWFCQLASSAVVWLWVSLWNENTCSWWPWHRRKWMEWKVKLHDLSTNISCALNLDLCIAESGVYIYIFSAKLRLNLRKTPIGFVSFSWVIFIVEHFVCLFSLMVSIWHLNFEPFVRGKIALLPFFCLSIFPPSWLCKHAPHSIRFAPVSPIYPFSGHMLMARAAMCMSVFVWICVCQVYILSA